MKLSKRSRHKVKLKVSNAYTKFTYLLVIALLLGIGYGLYNLLNNSTFFNVKKVQVVGSQSFVSSADIESVVLAKVSEKSLFRINAFELQTSLLKNFQGAKDIKVEKKYPHTLHLSVVERTPLAVIHSKGNYYLADDEGYVLGLVDANDTNLPVIEYTQDINVGLFLDRQLVPVYLQLLKALEENNLNVSSLSASKNYMSFYLNDNIQVYVDTAKDISTSIFTLSKLYNQLAQGEKQAKKIDLRYDKVIVSYE